MNWTLCIALIVILCVIYTISDRKQSKKTDAVDACSERLDTAYKQLDSIRTRLTDQSVYIDIIVMNLPDDIRFKISQEYSRAIDAMEEEPVYSGQSHDPND